MASALQKASSTANHHTAFPFLRATHRRYRVFNMGSGIGLWRTGDGEISASRFTDARAPHRGAGAGMAVSRPNVADLMPYPFVHAMVARHSLPAIRCCVAWGWRLDIVSPRRPGGQQYTDPSGGLILAHWAGVVSMRG